MIEGRFVNIVYMYLRVSFLLFGVFVVLFFILRYLVVFEISL